MSDVYVSKLKIGDMLQVKSKNKGWTILGIYEGSVVVVVDITEDDNCYDGEDWRVFHLLKDEGSIQLMRLKQERILSEEGFELIYNE